MSKAKIDDSTHSLARRLLFSLLAVLFIIALSFVPLFADVLKKADLKIRDQITKSASEFSGVEPNPDFIFLGVDSDSNALSEVDMPLFRSQENLEAFHLLKNNFPWSRKLYGMAIERLVDSGAQLVMVDFILSHPSQIDPDGDFYLMDVLDKHRDKVVLVSQFDSIRAGDNKQFRYVEPWEDFLGPIDDEVAVGYANFFREQDSIIRQAELWKYHSELNGMSPLKDEEKIYSFAMTAARKLGVTTDVRAKRMKLPSLKLKQKTPSGQKYIDPQEIYPPLSFASIFMDDEWREKYQDGEYFKNKVVMIGPSMEAFQDQHMTTFGQVHGAQLHLHTLNAILSNSWWTDMNMTKYAKSFLAAASVGILYALVCIASTPKLKFLIAYFFGGIVLWFFAVIAFTSADYLVSGIPYLMMIVAAFFAAFVCVSLEEIFRRMSLQRHLGRSMSPEVAAAVVKAPDGYYAAAKGRRLPVTILFSDIRGFTSLSESVPVGELIQRLNVYFEAMVNVIFQSRGTVDKFIGDAIMATWGELGNMTPEEQVQKSVNAAKGMLDELEKVNELLAQQGVEPLRIGIGLHHGSVLVGEIGSEQRTDFTVIGDSVNLASRLEALTSTLGVAVIFSDTVVKMASSLVDFHFLGCFQVKGKKEAVELYTLGRGGFERREVVQLSQAIKLGNKSTVLEMLDSCERSNDIKKMLDFYAKYMNSIDDEWDGVFTMTSK